MRLSVKHQRWTRAGRHDTSRGEEEEASSSRCLEKNRDRTDHDASSFPEAQSSLAKLLSLGTAQLGPD